MKFPVMYQNGTYFVHLNSDGVQTTVDPKGLFESSFPDTVDLKVTDYCDAGCFYCHENSKKSGKHANLENLIEILTPFETGVELAIGGGNPLDWPDLDAFLDWAKNRFVCNMTVNSKHLNKEGTLVRLKTLQRSGLLNGIGVSLPAQKIKMSDKRFGVDLKNTVGHLIPGMIMPVQIDQIIRELRASKEDQLYFKHYLLLGFKTIGRGKSVDQDKVDVNIEYFKRKLPRFIMYLQARGIKLSFDNLAIEQLNVKNIIRPEVWNTRFMGEDGTRSMFIDAVEETSAKSSTSTERVNWLNTHPLEYFKNKFGA